MPAVSLRRSLSLTDVTLLNVGTMVGSGIFLTSAAIARDLDGSLLHLAVWVLGGLFSVLGALVLAELGAMFPEAGGIYVYLARTFGPIWGFLYGWALFLAIQCGAIAAVAVAAATYLRVFVSMTDIEVRLVAVISIAGLTWINARAVSLGALVSNVLTVAKVSALVLLVALALGSGRAAHFSPVLPTGSALSLLAPFGVALMAAMWCYDGWIHVTFVAGEVRDPGRNIPRAAMASTLIVVALYLGLNAAYLATLGAHGMAASDLVAAETARAAIGPAGALFVSALVIVSCLGANNGFIMAGARVYYAMARDGYFLRKIADVDPDRATPAASLIAQGIWSCVLVFSGRYDEIFTYVMFVEFVFYGLAAVAVLVLRRRDPGAPRPYRTLGYPWTPIAFIVFSAGLLAATIAASPREAAIGTALTLAGLPAFLWWRKQAAGG
ncbi:MAG: amino acid permease [Acidobacteria bacterium]|nr:amino acid permease [Acidobacteriota bacterium]